VLQRGCSPIQRAAAQIRQASISSTPTIASASARPDSRLLFRCALTRAIPSVAGVPGPVLAGARVAGPVGPVGVALCGVVAPGVLVVGAVAGVELVGVLEPGATVPGWAPLAGVVAVEVGARSVTVPVDGVPWWSAEAGIVIFVPGTVAGAAMAPTGAIRAVTIVASARRRTVTAAPGERESLPSTLILTSAVLGRADDAG
jgi:hypothetical protein